MTTTTVIPAAIQHAANRRQNLPAWVNQAYPDHQPFAPDTQSGYLKDLYPHIWAWGPRGEIYMAQLTRFAVILDGITSGQDPFFDDLDFSIVDTLYEDEILEQLAQHAIAQGLPDTTLGIVHGMDYDEEFLYDPAYDNTPAQYVLVHPCWENYTGGIINFHEFLGRFALISIHRDFFVAHAQARAVLRVYDAFCDTWGLPR